MFGDIFIPAKEVWALILRQDCPASRGECRVRGEVPPSSVDASAGAPQSTSARRVEPVRSGEALRSQPRTIPLISRIRFCVLGITAIALGILMVGYTDTGVALAACAILSAAMGLVWFRNRFRQLCTEASARRAQERSDESGQCHRGTRPYRLAGGASGQRRPRGGRVGVSRKVRREVCARERSMGGSLVFPHHSARWAQGGRRRLGRTLGDQAALGRIY